MSNKLNKREEIASRMNLSTDELVDYAEIIMGKKAPEGRTKESVKWWIECEAKIKVMKTDALNNELERET